MSLALGEEAVPVNISNSMFHDLKNMLLVLINLIWWRRSAKDIFFDKKGFYINNPVSNLKIAFPIQKSCFQSKNYPPQFKNTVTNTKTVTIEIIYY